MTSKTITLRVLDGIIVAAVGFPMEWLSNLLDMSPHEFRRFSLFIIFAALWLMHAIAVSDSAP